MRISDSRYSRDGRRYALAYRLLRHNARTQTIVRWSGLSGYRVRTLHQEYMQEGPGAVRRHRGVPPYQLTTFSRTRVVKQETLTLAGLFQQASLIPPEPLHTSAEHFPNLDRGEVLCSAYETFRTLVPRTSLTIDHAALLAVALARGDEIRLARCSGCASLMVADRLSLRSQQCVYCEEEAEASRIQVEQRLHPRAGS